jgi:outer membrane scaffolding protein for murein synthesis (MipA/OmpV family)
MAGTTHADEAPLWEAGLGVGTLSVPDYRGSDQSHTYLLPVPYFVYRGDFLRADRDGARAMFIDQERFKLDLSLNASVPTRSSHNDARAGMHDLKTTLEVGPNLSATLWETADHGVKLDFRVPVRAAFTIDSSPSAIGFTASPNLNIDFEDVAGYHVGLLAGPLYATRRYHDYFYTVPQADVLPDRPAYRAPGGYAGAQVLASMSRRFPTFWVGGFVRADTLEGAAFADSPLVRQNHAYSAGLAISWILGESDRHVSVDR